MVGLVAAISEKIGEVSAANLRRPPAELRKKNRIRTIHSSLAIEGNTLSLEQVSTIFENKKIVGPQKDILEVRNAINTYAQTEAYRGEKQNHFLKAHGSLLQDLIADAGRYRSGQVGVMKGKRLAHLAPPPSQVPALMKELFSWLKSTKEHVLIASSVFHYEVQFIHPFSDGNGRMGRLWQSVLLGERFPVFQFLPVETIIRDNQKKYYAALSASDKSGNSTAFILFMLGILNEALEELLSSQQVSLSSGDRIAQIPALFGTETFSRKDYLRKFKGISTATASRDLQEAVAKKIIRKTGTHNQSIYRVR